MLNQFSQQMMRKIFIGSVSVVLFLILSLFIWTHLPLEIQRSSDIKKGNIIIKNLTDYKLIQGHLPETGDWKTLEQLGFSTNDVGTQPDYKKLSDTNYELTFLKGFDGPYLTYDLTFNKWVIK
jgi:hypothetical protein